MALISSSERSSNRRYFSHSSFAPSTLIDSKRKELFSEDHTLKSFAGDELAYLEEAHRRITTLHEELQSASNKLTTAHIIKPVKEVSFVREQINNVKKKEGK